MPIPHTPPHRFPSVFLAASLSFAAWSAQTWASDASEPLREDEFEKLHAEIKPGDEPWTTIPWQTSLIPAQHLAVTENKPLFVWAMDGHPMGCT